MDGPSTPQCGFHLPPADKGRMGPSDGKHTAGQHTAGHVLHQDAQSISRAHCRNSRIPASLCSHLGTTLDVGFKDSYVLPFRNERCGKVTDSQSGTKQAGMGENREGGICRRMGKKGSRSQRAGEWRRGKKKPAPEQKEKGERHVQTEEVGKKEPAPACLPLKVARWKAFIF